ncbi:related to integral membrane protein PTH11 [Phialocephala subalpina]|uniref:Related to integral membrane protein PTH11 n=1 Tax=Phialocephala subalpina TaxID=576137 RepID=A0A1L7XSB8_9HELO|nr:related to integral membrane protein PTH11 [Phialocephala subalpina]
MLEQDSEYLPEVWTLYGIGIAVLLLRFATRLKTVGLKGFQGDDYMSILTMAFYTAGVAAVHIIYYSETNVEASVVQLTKTLTDEEIAKYEFGSKEQLGAWYSYTALIWTMKATMLFFFDRLTIGLWQHKYVKWLAIICGVSYLAVVLTVTFGCFPTQKNWQVVPDPGHKCTLKLQNFLVTAVLNVFTDALILAIPLPLLWKLKVPFRRKLIIGLLLCSGLFVITAAIIRVVLTLGSNPSAININRWGVREIIVGIITINLPILRPLFGHPFWTSGTFKGTSHNLEGGRNIGGGGGYELSLSGKKGGGTVDVEAGLERQKKGSKREDSLEMVASTGMGSQEFIIQGKNDMGDGVIIETSYRVESEDEGDGGGVVGKGEGEGEGWRYGGSSWAVSKVTVHARHD